ncbi:MAG TPA: hypothetical protein VMT89_18885 [Candidatus Acidoferrales bacterium]|nr:hypothetical protein [Candidatus Acidoferrales bacterium]
MSDIYLAFERYIGAWQTRFVRQPERELFRLALLSLEREENVAFAYNQSVLGRRLAALPISESVRDLFRNALVQIWRDEEMHAVFIREALLKLGGTVVAVRTLEQQIAGRLGGWAVSVRQHRRWSEAPVSRSMATLLIWAGALSGRVPPEVRQHLDYGSFRGFCAYNVQTESTAWLCWRRLTELADAQTALPGVRIADLSRIADDEDRHRLLFKLFAECLTDDDRLRPGVSEESLAADISEVGGAFLGRT